MQVNQALFYPYTVPSAKVDILRDFKMVSKIQQNAMVFGVAKDSPDQTFPEFIKRCKAAKSPCSRSEEHTSELQSLMRISYAVLCLKKKTYQKKQIHKQ